LKKLLHRVKCLPYYLRYAHSYNQTIGKLVGSYDAVTNKEEVEAKVWSGLNNELSIYEKTTKI
jgi:hypothetical protein